jgi:large subunit ribosomal protein L18
MIVLTNSKRDRIRRRVRGKISGTAARPRLSVFKSSKHIYAQLIDDISGQTLAHASTLSKSIRELSGKKPVELAREVGMLIAEIAKEKEITTCVFDRSGYKYHGLVKEVADGARKGGLNF